jgi:hypothetical protein
MANQANTVQNYCFEWAGFGNYSDCHGWDNGVLNNLGLDREGKECQEQETVNEQEWDSFGGSRNASGYVVAPNRGAAVEALAHYLAERYPLEDYEVGKVGKSEATTRYREELA